MSISARIVACTVHACSSILSGGQADGAPNAALNGVFAMSPRLSHGHNVFVQESSAGPERHPLQKAKKQASGQYQDCRGRTIMALWWCQEESLKRVLACPGHKKVTCSCLLTVAPATANHRKLKPVLTPCTAGQWQLLARLGRGAGGKRRHGLRMHVSAAALGSAARAHCSPRWALRYGTEVAAGVGWPMASSGDDVYDYICDNIATGPCLSGARCQR